MFLFFYAYHLFHDIFYGELYLTIVPDYCGHGVIWDLYNSNDYNNNFIQFEARRSYAQMAESFEKVDLCVCFGTNGYILVL